VDRHLLLGFEVSVPEEGLTVDLAGVGFDSRVEHAAHTDGAEQD